MELWQSIISICAGIITIVTVFEKIGITNKFKKVDKNFTDLKQVPQQVLAIQNNLLAFGKLQKDQNNALLALLRSELYKSFKDNRDIEAWTDDEVNVQTKLHTAYKALNGNGEEKIWWEKKQAWKIVSNEEYERLILKNNTELCKGE